MTITGHIYIIDDDESMRNSLARVLNESGFSVEEYSSGRIFLKNSTPKSPSVIILDMQMQDLNGVQIQEQLLKLDRFTPIIFVSGQSHPQQIITALKQGAIDFFLKPFSIQDLLKSINHALELDRTHLIKLSQSLNIKKKYSQLTSREKEVCALLVQGSLNKEIAIELGIVDATVKVHKARIMEKLQADSLQALVKMYLEAGLSNP